LESIEKMRDAAIGRKHTDEVKELMSINRQGENNPFFGKNHSLETINLLRQVAINRDRLPKPGIEVEITDINTKVTEVYSSIRKAAKAIDSDIRTILRREKIQNIKGINTPYRNKYIITIKRN
jgi:hypothetical protein